MKTKPEILTQEGYQHFETLHHSELGKFLKPYLFKKNRFTIFYHLATFLPLAIFCILMGLNAGKQSFDFDHLSRFFYGFSIAFLLVPLHEYLHGLAYRYVGAGQVSYGADIKKFVFFAMADRFVANAREFFIVALTPFVVISLLAIALYFVLPSDWSVTMLGLLFVHSMFCGGDFGLLSYFEEHREKQMVTYDDVANQVSYFYVRN